MNNWHGTAEQDSYVGDSTHCGSCVVHTLCYENCCTWIKEGQHVREVFVAGGWRNTAVCRVVKAPVSTLQMERQLDGASSDGSGDQEVSCCASLGRPPARSGDTVIIHYGPGCHYICNAVICPCWHSKAQTITHQRGRRLIASAGAS
jgi:hypothetical protein